MAAEQVPDFLTIEIYEGKHISSYRLGLDGMETLDEVV
jgi:hypothetical protein